MLFSGVFLTLLFTRNTSKKKNKRSNKTEWVIMKQFVIFILLFRGFKEEPAAVVVYKQVYLPLFFTILQPFLVCCGITGC